MDLNFEGRPRTISFQWNCFTRMLVFILTNLLSFSLSLFQNTKRQDEEQCLWKKIKLQMTWAELKKTVYSEIRKEKKRGDLFMPFAAFNLCSWWALWPPPQANPPRKEDHVQWSEDHSYFFEVHSEFLNWGFMLTTLN